MARQVGFKDVLASYEGVAIQLGCTLILQKKNKDELGVNARERQHDQTRKERVRSNRENKTLERDRSATAKKNG